jgi:hypothetical protein
MNDEGGGGGAEEWQDWAEIVAADMVDPAIRAAVDEIVVNQDQWACE